MEIEYIEEDMMIQRCYWTEYVERLTQQEVIDSVITEGIFCNSFIKNQKFPLYDVANKIKRNNYKYSEKQIETITKMFTEYACRYGLKVEVK